MKKTSNKRIKFIYGFIYLIAIFLIVLSTIYIISFISLKKEAKEQSNLLEQSNYNAVESSLNNDTNSITQDSVLVESQETERMIKVKELKAENSDIVGWLEIANTNISYPVLQGTDNEYYMTHNYKKQKSKNGSIFLTYEYDWTIPSSNLLIYGHNLNNGTMFQELLKYADQSFYNTHPIIRFTTTNEDAEYEIISVFKSRVYYKSEKNVFRYYFFVNASTEEEYKQFVDNAKKASLYPIDATANYGEQLITLSTCSYHTEDGRFVVVGKKRNF